MSLSRVEMTHIINYRSSGRNRRLGSIFVRVSMVDEFFVTVSGLHLNRLSFI